MTSLWWDDQPAITSDELADDDVDDVVVGAGLTGVTTGLLLARAGRRVVVLEARGVAAAATGSTTGKLSLLQGTAYSELQRRHPPEVVAAYVEGNLEGQQWLLRFCAENDIAVEQRPAATFAPDGGEGLVRARAEHDAAMQAGLPVHWVDDLPVPFRQSGGTVLDDQAQIQPVVVVAGLVKRLRAEGGRVVTNVRVEGVENAQRPIVRCVDGRRIRSRTVILATGTPVLDRTLSFATQVAERSYAIAFAHPEPPELMLLSAHGPTRSVRDAKASDGTRRLIVGGEGHVVGRADSERACLDRLRDWVAPSFPGAVETHWWSAQDYRAAGRLPVIGEVSLGHGNIYAATGYAKWGMTNAVAAAFRLSGLILGGSMPWADRWADAPGQMSQLLEIARMNADVLVDGARHAVAGGRRALPSEPPPEGSGVVGRQGHRLIATSTVDGHTQSVPGFCTHLGGVLAWNDAECSWDCPLHGSRFSPSGDVLEGPATKPLRPLHERTD